MATRDDRPAAPRPQEQGVVPGKEQRGHHQYPQDSRVPLVPDPISSDEEIGIAGGVIQTLPSEFSWAEHHGEGTLPDADHPHRPHPSPQRRPASSVDDERREPIFGEAASSHESHRANPLRGTSFLKDS